MLLTDVKVVIRLTVVVVVVVVKDVKNPHKVIKLNSEFFLIDDSVKDRCYQSYSNTVYSADTLYINHN